MSKPISATASRRLAAVHEVAAGDLAGLLVPGRALRAREELVPAAVEGERPVGVDRVGPLDGDEVADRVLVEQPVQLGVLEGGHPGLGRADGVGRGRDRAREHLVPALVRLVERLLDPFEQEAALGEHQLDVDSGADLDRCVVLPGGDRRRPGVHLERPGALGVGGDPDGVLVGRAGVLDHPHRGSAYAVGAGQDDVRPELVVALAEHRRRHGKGLAERRLRRLSTEVDNGHDVHDGDASDHCPTLAERPESAQAGVASLSLVGRAA